MTERLSSNKDDEYTSSHLCVCVHAQCLCDPMDCGPPGSSVHGILQARTLEWVAISKDLPSPGIKPESPALAGGLNTTEPAGSPCMSLHVSPNPENTQHQQRTIA